MKQRLFRTRRLGVALIAGVTALGAVATFGGGVAGAATVSPTFSPSSTVVNATGVSWTVGYTPTPLATANGATLTIGFGTDIAGHEITVPAAGTPVTINSGTANCSASVTTANPAVTSTSSANIIITFANNGGTCAITGSALSLTIGGFTNPTSAGNIPGTDFTVTSAADNGSMPATPGITFNTGVTGVSFSPSTTAPSTSANWTETFTATTALAATNTVSVGFPGGFAVPAAPSVTFGGAFAGCGTAPVPGATNANVVTVTLPAGCALAAGAQGSVTVDGITNPTAGGYPASGFTVFTSADAAPVSPTVNVTIGGVPTVTAATVNPPGSLGNQAVTGSTLTITVNGGMALGDTIDLSLGCTGATFTGVSGPITVSNNGVVTSTATSNGAAAAR